MRPEGEPLDTESGLGAEQPEEGAMTSDAEAAAWDVAEQHRGVQPDVGEEATGPDPSVEADEADVADQQRPLPHFADDEER